MAKKKDVIEIKIKYHIPDDHRLHYVTGAWGGVSPDGMVEMNFYHERPPLPKDLTIKADADGKIINEEPNTKGYAGIRSVQTGITMNINTAREVLKWLEDNIEAFEKLRK